MKVMPGNYLNNFYQKHVIFLVRYPSKLVYLASKMPFKNFYDRSPKMAIMESFQRLLISFGC